MTFDEYMEAAGWKPVPPEALEPFLKAMDEAIVKIEAAERRRLELAEEARHWVLL